MLMLSAARNVTSEGLRKISRLAIARHILGPLINYAVIRPLMLSNGVVAYDLEWPLTRFQGHNTFLRRIRLRLRPGRRLETKLLSNGRQAIEWYQLSVTLSDPWPGFQGGSIFWCYVCRKRCKEPIPRHSYYWTLTGNHKPSIKWRHV